MIMRNVIVRLLAFSAVLSALVSCAGDGVKCVQYHSASIRYNDPVSITLRDGVAFDAALCNDSRTVAGALKVSPSFEYDIAISSDGAQMFLYPKQPLKYNMEYKIKGDFASLAGQKSCVETLVFRTLKPQAVLTWSPLMLSDGELGEGKKGYCAALAVTSADPLDGALLEKHTHAPKVAGKMSWTHSADGLEHDLFIGPALSGKIAYDFTVSVNCDDYGISEEKTYSIPEADDFYVVEVNMTQQPYCYEVTFTDVLKEKQDFESLVSMPGAGRLSFVVAGNVLKISPSVKAETRQELRLSSMIENSGSVPMKAGYERTFDMPSAEPSMRFISSGTILPSSSGLNIYFESCKYRKVRVRCHRIYENNILQFLQNNSLTDADTYIGGVARQILDTVMLLGTDESRLDIYGTYGLNLEEMVKVQRGAIYKVEIGGVEPMSDFNGHRFESEYWLGRWEDYADRARNVLVSDLGVIAKASSGGEYAFIVTDLVSASPEGGAEVKVYNDVNQLLATGRTDAEGRCSLQIPSDRPRTAIVSKGTDKSYISLVPGEALSLSNFDVAGNASKGGCKAFVFGERGVWRPGDDIHLCFMAVPDKGSLPAGHPVSASLVNPQGQVISTLTSNDGHDGMYAFCFHTAADAPTGKWDAEFTMGAQTWHKAVRIETVKPNNILIDLRFDKEVPYADEISAGLDASFLTGRPAAGLQVRMEANLGNAATAFKQYPGYVFTDDTRLFQSQTVDFFSGVTGSDGRLKVKGKIDAGQAPGMVKAAITTRVFEKNGDFSTSLTAVTVSPYRHYVGIKVPLRKDDWGDEFLDVTTVHQMEMVVVDADGVPASGDVSVDVEVFKMGWNWWWSSSSERLAEYARDSFTKPYMTSSCVLKGGRGTMNLDFRKSESGLYFIRAVDRKGGHAASQVVPVYRSDEGRATGEAGSAISLSLSVDKTAYQAGETAHLSIPSAAGSRALVSLEKGGSILRSFWTSCGEGTTVIDIPLTLDMAPDIYASVTLIQPYNSTFNDAPMRLFGVQRINVEDASTHIRPVLDVAGEVRPESRVKIKVKERDGRPMSFMLAVVDEGLLNLTGFRTPDPWKSFFATEALEVSTWDLYNSVIGAYGARMEQLFAIGGDGEAEEEISPENKARRFPPVSIVRGPFTLGGGQSREIDVDMPKYIGNVRVMAVATDGRNMGNASANVSVTKPLMVKMTLPRVVGTDDEVQVPVTVITTKDGIGDVKVRLSAGDGLEVKGSSVSSVRMTAAGENTVYFSLKASSVSGIAHVKAVCECAGDTSTDEVEIAVREANTRLATSETLVLEAGKKGKAHLEMAGRKGTNKVSVEASTMPSIDLEARLGYLLSYPHGCLEQIVSAAFPQLYLPSVVDLNEAGKRDCAANVSRVLSSIPSYAIPSSGFTTWSGTSDYAGVNVWASIYATHFMLEAAKAGYSVPGRLRDSALRFVRKVTASRGEYSMSCRCYAAYVLALAGSADRSAMARLRENASTMSGDCALMLACAYAVSGNRDVARDLYVGRKTEDNVYDPYDGTYSSDIRSMAQSAILCMYLGDRTAAFKEVTALAGRLNDGKQYMSTQTTAWALLSVAEYLSGNGSTGAVDISAVAGGTPLSLKGARSVMRKSVAEGNGSSMDFEFTNNSASTAYVVVSSEGYAARGGEVAVSNGLKLDVEYCLPDGTAVDPSSLERGTDFTCRTTVTNTGLPDRRDVALSELFPCGWEIRNDRNDSKDLHQDWRDDRVYSYFDLAGGESVTIDIRLVASYAGTYYHPAITAEAMYDGLVNAVIPGFEVTVR